MYPAKTSMPFVRKISSKTHSLGQSSNISNSSLESYQSPGGDYKQSESLIDQREQRILNFLEGMGLELKNPIEKYYDFCDGERRKNSECKLSFSLNLKTSCNSLGNKDEEPMMKSANLVLSSALYKKRKFSTLQPEGSA